MDLVEEFLRKQLTPGEQLLWWGRPAQGVILRPADTLLIPFSLLWGGFAIFWEYMVLSSGNAPVFFAVWGVPFVAIGLYLIAGRFFFDAWQRAHTLYAVTNQRILIMSGLKTWNLKSINLRTLSDLSLSERSRGLGSISFGPPNPLAWTAGSGWPGRSQATPSFELIPDARSVYELIRRAQESRSSP